MRVRKAAFRHRAARSVRWRNSAPAQAGASGSEKRDRRPNPPFAGRGQASNGSSGPVSARRVRGRARLRLRGTAIGTGGGDISLRGEVARLTAMVPIGAGRWLGRLSCMAALRARSDPSRRRRIHLRVRPHPDAGRGEVRGRRHPPGGPGLRRGRAVSLTRLVPTGPGSPAGQLAGAVAHVRDRGRPMAAASVTCRRKRALAAASLVRWRCPRPGAAARSDEVAGLTGNIPTGPGPAGGRSRQRVVPARDAIGPRRSRGPSAGATGPGAGRGLCPGGVRLSHGVPAFAGARSRA